MPAPLTSPPATDTPAQFDPSLYPRTYRPTTLRRSLWTIMSAFFGLPSLFGVFFFCISQEAKSYLAAFVCLLFLLLAVYVFLYVLRSKLALTPDAVEYTEVFTTKRLLRAEIAAWRMYSYENAYVLELKPADHHKKRLKLTLSLKRDALFDAWFAALPSLDDLELAQSAAQFAANQEVGVTPEQRLEHLVQGQKLSRHLLGVAVLLAFWGCFYPRPYPLVILLLIVLPLFVLLLALHTRGLYRLEIRRNDVRPGLALSFILPTAALCWRCLTDYWFLEVGRLLLLTLICSVILALLAAIADPQLRSRRWPVLVFFVLGALYSYSAFAQADALLDRSPRQIFHVPVLSKRISGGRSASYYLRIPPWESEPQESEISVPSSFYNSVVQGQIICIYRFRGALQVPGYVVNHCPVQPNSR